MGDASAGFVVMLAGGGNDVNGRFLVAGRIRGPVLVATHMDHIGCCGSARGIPRNDSLCPFSWGIRP